MDEKPSIQAIERASGYVETDSGKVLRALKSTYKRHGTLNLFAALEVGTGRVHTKFTENKKREDFRDGGFKYNPTTSAALGANSLAVLTHQLRRRCR